MSPEFRTSDFDFQQQAFTDALPAVVDWFVMEGGDIDLTYRPPLGHPAVDLRGIQYFLGIPTAAPFHPFDLEIAALIWEKPPFDEDSVRSMIGNSYRQSEADNMRDFVEFGEEGVWAVTRLTAGDIHGPGTLAERLEHLVHTAEDIHGRIS